EDLEKYQAIWRKPIEFSYKGYNITSMTLPASGGICLAQILKSIEPFDLDSIKHNSTQYIQLLTEAERRSYADRAHYLGDIDFVDVPIDSLTNSKYINQRMSSFSWKKATPSSEVSQGKILGYESNETTHYSIVDQFGNAVAVTTTLNTNYGSKVLVKDAGFFLNNEMDDFSSKPGVPNVYGLVGSEANAIAPEKRMLSSMTPTIVEKNGKLFMVVGTPGGSTIITSVLQNIINVVDYKMGMQESVNQPRFHHQWLPDEIKLEPNSFDEKTKKELTTLGYTILEKNSTIIGRVDAILVLPNGKLEGGADPRGDDTAVGF
ncbi:MAG: gamma-glutamyltransferase, partial [Polaribacter sp.]|nr:gamma-glutamyltransferase [Polaribacter sp.]